MSDQDSQSESENDFQYDDELLQFGSLNFTNLKKRLETATKSCLCKDPKDKASALCLMSEMMNYDIQSDRHNCVIDNIIRCFNTISKKTSIDDPYRVAYTDLFYRMRHELLFKMTMLALNMPAEESDVPFSAFGIDSKRTPDLILKQGKTLVIIEIAASSNFENASRMKGSEELGFESKYRRELDILVSLSVQHVYLPFIYDMSNIRNDSYMKQIEIAASYFKINNLYKMLLEVIVRSLSSLTNQFKELTIPSSSYLFSTFIPIKKNHKDLEFLYKDGQHEDLSNEVSHHYIEYYVSIPTYRKIYNNWHRFPIFIDRLKRSGRDSLKKYIIILDIKTNRIAFEEDRVVGVQLDEFEECYNRNDKPFFFKKSYISVGERLIPAIDSETGVLFKEKVKTTKGSNESKTNYPDVNCYTNHSSVVFEGEFKLDYYESILAKHYSEVYRSVHYDVDYEDTLLSSIREYDKECLPDINNEIYTGTGLGMLSDMKTDTIDMLSEMAEIKKLHVAANIKNDDMPIKEFRTKNPFLMPMSDLCSTDYSSLDYKNVSLIDKLISEIRILNPFTTLVLEKVKNIDYSLYDRPRQQSEYLNDIIREKSIASRELTKITRTEFRGLSSEERNLRKGRSIKEFLDQSNRVKFEEITRKISILDKKIKKRMDDENLKRNIGLIRLPTRSKRTELGLNFEKEMSHFKDKKTQSTYKGVGIKKDFERDHQDNFSVFKQLIDNLPDYRGKNEDLLMDKYVDDDSRLLKDLKQRAINDYSSLIENVKNSLLGHSAAFVSRLGHSLLFYSQMPFNSDYIRVDNLGYNCCFLIIRGGKKIFKSKSSKLFRIFYPINDCILPWVTGDLDRPTSNQVININKRHFMLTPWMMWHESILTDSLSFYTRVVSFTVLNLQPTASLREQFNKLAFNIILAFHNRRQSEVLLSNMRYILLSTLGDFTGIPGVLPDFVGFNYDSFQSLIRSLIIVNYPSYFNSIVSMNKNSKSISHTFLRKSPIVNIFTGSNINDPDDLTLMIYSTFLMTKAPYQKNVERANNIKGMLKIHELYDTTVGLDLTQEEQCKKLSVTCDGEGQGDFKKYIQKLFESDFSFDPKYCANLGVFADSYLKNRNMKDRLHSEWIRIINNSWDNLATSTGLRGEIDGKSGNNNFWGQKGYFIVYRNLADIPDYVKRTKMILCADDMTDDERRRELRLLNKLYIEKIGGHDTVDNESSGLIFHVVDKVQWKGSREIYVMDLKTKQKQQPIEQFMGFLSKNVENELISVPSDKRAQVIHHSIFEKDLPIKDIQTWYLTLDCTKWAPKSIFVKFAIMILNMDIIPPSFKTHFLNYLDKLYKKKIYFNKPEVEVLLKNSNYTDLINKYFTEDKNIGGFYMKMPYSWVMGIFNYTSSFMHSINQLYASYLISKSSLENLNEEVNINMFAHSDDSGGRLSCRNKSIAQRCIMLYEVNLKCSNHLISRKKSVISKIYFEILSIIYLFKKLLALLPKFLGGLRFLPTDKGPAQDLLQAYSKCNEVMVAGANFSIAYIVMKIMSMLIWRFYFNRNPVQTDYERPVQYLGMPDAHPLMVLITGSDSDVVRLISTGRSNILKSQMNLVNNLTESIDEPGPIRPFKYNIKVRNIGKTFERELALFSDETKKWSVKNVNFKSSPFNMLNFFSKLEDPGFVGSMMNESTTRRLSRCYYMRSNDSLITRSGLTSSISMIMAMEKLKLIEKEGEMSELILKSHYKDREEFLADFEKNKIGVEAQYRVLTNILAGPIKICNYLDKLDLKNRELREVDRTLKPTHVQLYKTGKCFSVDFDPAQLVAYIKKDSLLWAIPNINRIDTAAMELKILCENLDLDINMLDENTLLKLCRNYNTKNVKDIYLYSQIPSEIRNIKTYSSFLSFIATNSLGGYEIGGLTLNLGNRMNDPAYVTTQIEDEIYTHNTILTLLLAMAKDDKDFVSILMLNKMEDIGWKGGSVNEYLLFLRKGKYSNPDHTLLKIQIEYLLNLLTDINIGCEEILEGSSYYLFTKSQKSKSGWRGSGEILICVCDDYFLFELYNDKLVRARTNKEGKVNRVLFSFISDTLLQNNIRIDPNSLQKPNSCKTNLVFGYDNSGDISVCSKRECSSSIECEVGALRIQFINDLPFSTIKHLNGDTYSVETEISNVKKAARIKCLRPKNSELATIASIIFKPECFENKLNEMGLGSLEEFIYTELLVKMGSDVHIKFDDLYDNFNSSKLYKIIKTVNDYDSEFIPKRIQTSQLPASKGGLFRIFLEYGRITGQEIVKTPSYITPEILAIRGEYPDKFSLILREKMTESYNSLFTDTEKNEMYDSYMDVLETEDEEQLRPKIVNLMCYWGYDSLVNSLNLFTYTKSKENFKTFSIDGPGCKELNIFSSLFERTIIRIVDCINKYRHLFTSLEYPVEQLGLKDDSVDLEFLPMGLTYNLYSYEVRQLNKSLPLMIFYNLLLSLLKDYDFCKDLMKCLNDVPAISTLEINYENRDEFIATLNVLKYSWIEVNKTSRPYDLDPVKKLERLDEGITQPSVYMNRLSGTKSTAKSVYNHGFLDNIFFNDLNKNITFRVSETNYRISQRISKLSNKKTSINRYFRYKRPISDELFEDADYEDFDCELTTPDNELEDIQGFLDDTGFEIKYKPAETRMTRHKGSLKTVDAMISWVFFPGGEGAKSPALRMNQISENVVMISDCFHSPVLNLRNGFVRIVDLSSFCGKRMPLMLAHVIHSKHLDKEFWNYYLPGEEFLPISRSAASLGTNIIRRSNDYKLVDYWDIGGKSAEELFTSKPESSKQNEEGGLDKEEECVRTVGNPEETEELIEYDKALFYIKLFNENGEISDELASQLTEKYSKLKDDFTGLRNKPKKLDLLSLLKDIKINNLVKLVKNDILLDLSKEQIRKIMQSPEHFGLAHGISEHSDRHIKDRHVKAELNSLEKDLMELITSGGLSMSKEMKALCKSGFRLWNQSVKKTNYKKEQKEFLLTLFLTVVSDSNLATNNGLDEKWQRIFNKIQMKIAEEDESEESSEDEHVFRPVLRPSSRILYRAVNS